jgi:hypothetical protein
MNDQVCFKPRPFEAAFLQPGTGYGAFTLEMAKYRKHYKRKPAAACAAAGFLIWESLRKMNSVNLFWWGGFKPPRFCLP